MNSKHDGTGGQPNLMLSRRQWIAYVGPFAFPDGGAASRRIIGNAESLVDGGYDVVVASGQPAQGTIQYEPFSNGIDVISLGERDAEHLPRPVRRIRYIAMGRITRGWLDGQQHHPEAVILYSGYTPYLANLIPWCSFNRVPLIFDAVEWYQPTTNIGWLVSPYQWNIEIAMRWLVKRSSGVIAISDYLSEYYRNAGKPVLRIPPTLRVGKRTTYKAKVSDNKLDVCYVGSPGGNKDELVNVFRAIQRVCDEGVDVTLHVAGPSDGEIRKITKQHISARQPGWLRNHGRLSHQDAACIVRRSDFSILVRRDSRVSQAGFSTKFVESLASGTPVIGNITGDLAAYLRDGSTGIVCKDWAEESIRAALIRAVHLSPIRHQEMRQHCRDVAERHFDFRNYTVDLKEFIRGLRYD